MYLKSVRFVQFEEMGIESDRSRNIARIILQFKGGQELRPTHALRYWESFNSSWQIINDFMGNWLVARKQLRKILVSLGGGTSDQHGEHGYYARLDCFHFHGETASMRIPFMAVS